MSATEVTVSVRDGSKVMETSRMETDLKLKPVKNWLRAERSKDGKRRRLCCKFSWLAGRDVTVRS